MSIESSMNVEANVQEIMNFYVETAELEKMEELAQDKPNLVDDCLTLESNAVVYDKPREYDPFENSSQIKTFIKLK